MKKIIFIAYCFLCCAIFAQEKKENIVAKVQVSALKKRNVYETLIYGARLEPAALIPVYSPGNGIVNKLTAQEGMMVTKDSLLAEVKRKNLSSDFLPWQVKSPIDGIVAYVDTVQNSEVFDKTIELSCDYSIVSEFRFNGEDYAEEKFVAATNSLSFGKIMPAEFKIFTVIK